MLYETPFLVEFKCMSKNLIIITLSVQIAHFKENHMKIGDNIKNLRELKNYTQAYMAERLNMSISGYSKIEKNKTDVALSKILTIAEILETDISTLLNFDAKQVVYQTNNHSVVAGGYNNTQNINGNIENILSNIQEEIQKLKRNLNQ